MTNAATWAAIPVALALAGAAEAATYGFDATVDAVSVNGFFEVDETSPNFVGGGTTTVDDLLDFSFTLTNGASTLTGTLDDASRVGAFDVTYSDDLSVATSFDIPIDLLTFRGGIAIDVDPDRFFIEDVFFDPDTGDTIFGPLDTGFVSGVLITSTRTDAPAPVPLPAGLPLLVGALAGLGLLRRRAG